VSVAPRRARHRHPSRTRGRTRGRTQAARRQQSLGGNIGREWPGEQVALPDVAAHLAQRFELAFRLDALGDHADVQSVGERDDGIDDRPVDVPSIPDTNVRST